MYYFFQQKATNIETVNDPQNFEIPKFRKMPTNNGIREAYENVNGVKLNS